MPYSLPCPTANLSIRGQEYAYNPLCHLSAVTSRSFRVLPLSSIPQHQNHSTLPFYSGKRRPLTLHVFQCGHSLNHSCRTSHRNTPIGDIPTHHAPGPNRTTLTDRHAGQNDRVPSNPAIIPDRDSTRELDVLPPRSDFSLVRRGENAYEGAQHDPVADRNQGTVENH